MCNNCQSLKLSRAEALKIIKAHGFTAEQQTAYENGEAVKSGTSFDENLGVKDFYSPQAVRIWLGY